MDRLILLQTHFFLVIQLSLFVSGDRDYYVRLLPQYDCKGAGSSAPQRIPSHALANHVQAQTPLIYEDASSKLMKTCSHGVEMQPSFDVRLFLNKALWSLSD